MAAATLMRDLQPGDGLALAGAVLVSGPYNARLEAPARGQVGVPTPDPRNAACFGPDASTGGREHGHAPALKMIRHHNHFSQVLGVNAGDRALVDPVLAFLRGTLAAAG